MVAYTLQCAIAMVGKTFSASLQGIDGAVIEIEASCQRSLPKIQITGLPGEIIRESRERIRAALVNLGFDVPSAQLLVTCRRPRRASRGVSSISPSPSAC